MKKVLGSVATAAVTGAIMGGVIPSLGLLAGAVMGVLVLAVGASFYTLAVGGGAA